MFKHLFLKDKINGCYGCKCNTSCLAKTANNDNTCPCTTCLIKPICYDAGCTDWESWLEKKKKEEGSNNGTNV